MKKRIISSYIEAIGELTEADVTRHEIALVKLAEIKEILIKMGKIS